MKKMLSKEVSQADIDLDLNFRVVLIHCKCHEVDVGEPPAD